MASYLSFHTGAKEEQRSEADEASAMNYWR